MAAGAHAHGRRIKRRAADSMEGKKTKTKQDKTRKEQKKTRNARERQHRIRKHEETSGGYKFAPLVAINSQLSISEPYSTSKLALGYPLLGPCRHVRAYS